MDEMLHEQLRMTKVNMYKLIRLNELDGIGHVDNRPSTEYLHHFVKQTKTLHLTPDTWPVICDTWQMVGGANILLKFQLPSSYSLW